MSASTGGHSRSSRAAADQRPLDDAFNLKLLAPSWDLSEVLHAVGMDKQRPDYNSLRMQLRDRVRAHTYQHGVDLPATSVEGRVNRAATMCMIVKYHPEYLEEQKPIKQPDIMKFCGFEEIESRTSTVMCMRVYRRLGKAQKQAAARANTARQVAGTAARAASTRRPASVSVDSDDDVHTPNLSPLTQDSSSTNSLGAEAEGDAEEGTVEEDEEESEASPTTGTTLIPDDFEENHCVWEIPYPDELERQCTPPNGKSTCYSVSLASRPKPRSLQGIATTTNTRNTTQQAQQDRQLLAEGASIRSSLHKSATTLCAAVVQQENTLSNFSTADKVATAFNVMSGAEFLSGNEIQAAVRTGNEGKSPPRRGRSSSVPTEEFNAFCDATFSFSAIEQINSTPRTKKMELMSLVGEILNDKRREDGEDGKCRRFLSPLWLPMPGAFPMFLAELGDVNFHRRIEMALCRKQHLASPDKRETIRVHWLTHTAQKLNYERWEECLADLGFARHPREGEDTGGEFIVWHDGQQKRAINLDEMSLSLDSSSTRGAGRPAAVPMAIGVHGDGDPAPKSSDKCTAIFGMNFDSEAMPPCVQFPTRAKDLKRCKLHCGLLESLRQVQGRFGYSASRWHDTGFGMNPKGGMGKASFFKYITEFVFRLYPDAADVPGKRVMIKIDSGPGRMYPELQQRLRARGFHMFPGVPNGTEVGQEMDQLHAYCKSLSYKNREELIKARTAANPDNTSPLSLADVGWLIFGGKVPLSDGSSVTLVPAFNMAFDKAHLDRAKAKCGYYPSTRAALKSAKVRRVLAVRRGPTDSESDSESVDTEVDPIAAMHEEIEIQVSLKLCLLLLVCNAKFSNALFAPFPRITMPVSC